jgi:hypothetical protein
MALPSNYKKNISILPKKFGPEQREELLNQIMDNGTYLPRGVMAEDLDSSFIEFIKKDLEIIIDGEKIPVIFLTLQRWMEFSRTWEFTDKHKDIKIPFITIVRKPDIQPGTDQQGLWNTATRLTYNYFQVPTFDGIRKGVDVYKIPQPTAIDLSYEVRIFCNKMRDLNKMQVKVHQAFRSRQFYISPNGHPMPIVLDSIGDESPISDFENRRFYVQLFDMRLQGYILDSDEFQIIPAKNRSLLTYEINNKISKPIIRIKAEKDTSLITYNLIFKPLSDTVFTTTATFDMKFTTLVGLINITSLIITVNNNIVTTPFIVSIGDEITFTITKPGQLEGRFTLNGNLL